MGYNSSISKQSFIFISIVLLTSITSVPAIQSQSPIQTQTQLSTTDNSQIVKEIAEKVATANPGTNATFVEQILTELAKQSTQVSNQGNALDEIYSQVSTYPYGIVSQSLARFASVLSTDSSILLPTVQKIIQEKATGKSISQSIVNISVQEASGGGKNVNDEIVLAAQIIAKQSPGIPVQNIESIIIQMALEISRAQGKAITGQTIFEIASQIKSNPNGILTQALIQLTKQDKHDNGKTSQTVNVIKKVAKVVEYRAASDEEGNAGNGQQPTKPVVPGPQPTKPIKILSPTDKWGIFRDIAKLALPSGWFNLVDKIVQGVAEKVPPGFSDNIEGTIVDIGLRLLNNAGPEPGFQRLTSLQVNMQTNPNLLQKVGQLAALYQARDDLSAAHTADIIADKLVAGVDPAVAIEETPIPQPEISFAITGETEPLSTGELEVKSLPPYYEDTTIPTRDGSIGMVDPLAEPVLVPETTGSFIPGLGPSQPPLFQEQITSLPPEDSAVKDQPEVDTAPPLTTPISNPCQISPSLCQQQEPLQEFPPVDLCQEQPDLPQCPQEDNDSGDAKVEYSDVSDENTVFSYFDEDIGGYQKEEDDYEEVGGYSAAEEDYSQEEDSGDKEDDYEEVGGYQEEEEQYNEEDSEEDFSQEEDESGEYYEE